MSDRPYIPNLDSFSTIIDRYTIEIVKRSHFEFLTSHPATPPESVTEYSAKIRVQNELITHLRSQLITTLMDILRSGKYDVISEERTFE